MSKTIDKHFWPLMQYKFFVDVNDKDLLDVFHVNRSAWFQWQGLGNSWKDIKTIEYTGWWFAHDN